MADPFEEERRQAAQDFAERDMDPIPGAQIQNLAEEVAKSVSTFILNRDQLRLARIPELAQDVAPREYDEEWLRGRERDYLEARTFLREAAYHLVEQIDSEFEEERQP